MAGDRTQLLQYHIRCTRPTLDRIIVDAIRIDWERRRSWNRVAPGACQIFAAVFARVLGKTTNHYPPGSLVERISSGRLRVLVGSHSC